MAVTSQQIADMAGVSRGTVDRVLNGRPGVSEANRVRVQAIADKLGYVPNRAGKALSTAKKPVQIGLVLSCVDNPFYDEVIRGIEACRNDYPEYNIEYRYRRLKGYSPLEQADALEKLSDCNVVLITPVNEQMVVDKVNTLTARGIPVITLNSDLEHSDRLLHVGCDYLASGRTAGGLAGLLANGRGRVGIVTGSLRMLGHRQRVDGFRAVMREEYPAMEEAWLLETNDDDRRAYEMLLRQMERDGDVSALYFGVGGIPDGVRAVVEADASGRLPVIVACDDIPQTREYIHRGVIEATVCQEPYWQGHEAVRQALEYWITGKKPEPDIIHTKNEIKIRHNL
ncbi:LacI family DNA-binding transcriptional regulator [Ruminococcaceae bacterium OttesenSCG-928-L11]|nr:LacI family DNA-binding transcriptional regulator [Ruminococcaceae bacterium OttesenSCG-928-L11]